MRGSTLLLISHAFISGYQLFARERKKTLQIAEDGRYIFICGAKGHLCKPLS